MRINTSLSDNHYQELKREDLEILGTGGYLYPPFGQGIKDYVEIHIHDKNKNFKEKIISEHTTFVDGKIKMNLGQDLRSNGYDRGIFVVQYYFIRPVAGADDIVLTKTQNGVSGIVHHGNPELTGISSTGNFYLDEEEKPFVGNAPPAEGEPKPLDIKEWKYKIDEISTSRTEVRIVPQIISNAKYKSDFRKLIENTIKYIPETAWDDYIDANQDLLSAWNIIKNLPDNDLSKWWRPRLEYQDNITSKKDFGKLHYTMYGYNENRNANPGDGGGQISWTGPDSARLQFNVRRETEDEGFQPYMQGGTLVVKDAYTVDEEIQANSFENPNYSTEDPIPDTHIEVTDSSVSPRAKTYTMMLRNREGDTINDDGGAEFNTNSQQVQYFWDFGCGHTEGPTTSHQVVHEYDEDGSYLPSCVIMTPNFDSNVTDVKTITGKNESPVQIQMPVGQTLDEEGNVVEGGTGNPTTYIADGTIVVYSGTFWLLDKGKKRFIVSYGYGHWNEVNGRHTDSLPVNIDGAYSVAAQELLLTLFESKGINTAKPEWWAWRVRPTTNATILANGKNLLRNYGDFGTPEPFNGWKLSQGDDAPTYDTWGILTSPSFIVTISNAVKNAIPDGPPFRPEDMGATESTANQGEPRSFSRNNIPFEFWPSTTNVSGRAPVQVTVTSVFVSPVPPKVDAEQGVGFDTNPSDDSGGEESGETDLGTYNNPVTTRTVEVAAGATIVLRRTTYNTNQNFLGWTTNATFNQADVISTDDNLEVDAPLDSNITYYAHTMDL